jgi:cysteine-rich repeat protein
MRRARIVLFGLLALSACKSKDTYQGVFVDVRNPADVAGIAALLVHVSDVGAAEKHFFFASGASGVIEFPASFSLTVPASRSGEVDIFVEAMDASQTNMTVPRKDAMVANGAGLAVLVPDTFQTAIVNLQPGATLCGNGQADPGETCDDGNNYSGDGCSYLCKSDTVDGASAEFGQVCAAPAECGALAPYCAVLPGQSSGFCTAFGCDQDASICPSTWTCMDLSPFGMAAHMCVPSQ